jgi:hypothetical protein
MDHIKNKLDFIDIESYANIDGEEDCIAYNESNNKNNDNNNNNIIDLNNGNIDENKNKNDKKQSKKSKKNFNTDINNKKKTENNGENIENNGDIKTKKQKINDENIDGVMHNNNDAYNDNNNENGNNNNSNDNNNNNNSNNNNSNDNNINNSKNVNKSKVNKKQHDNKFGLGKEINIKDLPPLKKENLTFSEIGNDKNVGFFYSNSVEEVYNINFSTPLINNKNDFEINDNVGIDNNHASNSIENENNKNKILWLQCPIGVTSYREGI